MRYRPLQIVVEGNELIIRIGTGTIKQITESHPEVRPLRVIDEDRLARQVGRLLKAGRGHRSAFGEFIAAAVDSAATNGSVAVARRLTSLTD